jgi:hypothetical protein
MMTYHRIERERERERERCMDSLCDSKVPPITLTRNPKISDGCLDMEPIIGSHETCRRRIFELDLMKHVEDPFHYPCAKLKGFRWIFE